jgi:hypothetical protein
MVKYINRRIDILFHLKSAASFEHQQRVWAHHLIQADDFDEVVHILFDDTGLAENPEGELVLSFEIAKRSRPFAL